ncbi:putative orfan [Tupanvirus soda lake]|uniref:Orfan n=2 Tax=Tupanvirus TaxID=2094720 RepID=A0AC62AB51_9VIRU|nr:putative orfan [Tupanvirus soda lake]QKU35016.1 putative orfan [Tupanvirus soda lake]
MTFLFADCIDGFFVVFDPDLIGIDFCFLSFIIFFLFVGDSYSLSLSNVVFFGIIFFLFFGKSSALSLSLSLSLTDFLDVVIFLVTVLIFFLSSEFVFFLSSEFVFFLSSEFVFFLSSELFLLGDFLFDMDSFLRGGGGALGGGGMLVFSLLSSLSYLFPSSLLVFCNVPLTTVLVFLRAFFAVKSSCNDGGLNACDKGSWLIGLFCGGGGGAICGIGCAIFGIWPYGFCMYGIWYGLIL